MSLRPTRVRSVGPATRERIASILKIPNTRDWNVIDSFNLEGYGDLYMVRYAPEADLDIWGKINGIVVDTTAGIVVCRSFGHSSVVITDEIIDGGEPTLNLLDTKGKMHSFDVNRVKFKKYIEGTTIRIFKWGGIIFMSSYTKLNTSASRWGDSMTFTEIYKALNGPDPESLFDPRTLTSPACYTFILVDPTLLIVTKENVGSGYIAYMGVKVLWSIDFDQCPYKQLKTDGTPYNSSFSEWQADPRPSLGYIPAELRIPVALNVLEYPINRPVLYSPSPMSLYEVNMHLQYGYWPPFETHDLRLRAGESVVMYYESDMMQHEDIAVQIMSTSYNWRRSVRGDDSNLRVLYYSLLDNRLLDIRYPDKLQEFIYKFPIMQNIRDTEYVNTIINTIKNEGLMYVTLPLIPTLPPPDPRYLMSDDLNVQEANLIYNIWASILLTVPLSQQLIIAKLYLQYFVEVNTLVDWITEKTLNPIFLIEDTASHSYVINLIGRIRATADNEIRLEHYHGLPRAEIYKLITRLLVNLEHGNVVRKMYASMKKINYDESKKNEEMVAFL